MAAKTSENSFDAIGQKWAVSYKRVSTANQKLYRQDQALKDWLPAHPEYKEDVEAGREEWKTGEHPGLDMTMDTDGNVYERIDGEWVKT